MNIGESRHNGFYFAMGLDAHVRCNCAKEGKTNPFPFPGRLAFEESGEPYLLRTDADSKDGIASTDMDELRVFDKWEYNQGCEHERFLVDLFIGNISYVGHIREWINTESANTRRTFPILAEKVVYSGSHGGDWVTSSEARALLEELEILSPRTQDEDHKSFIQKMQQLCEASLATGNPIVF